MEDNLPPCARCLHDAEAHCHWREGEECSRCDCPDYKRPGWTFGGVWLVLTAAWTELRRR